MHRQQLWIGTLGTPWRERGHNKERRGREAVSYQWGGKYTPSKEVTFEADISEGQSSRKDDSAKSG